MMAELVFRIDEGGFQEAFRSWNGMTGRFMEERGQVLCAKAQADAPVGEPGEGHQPGLLKASITTYPTTDNGELCIRVGTEPEVDEGNIGYAYFVHQGTRSHPILPVRAKKLRFVVDGHVIYARKVNHPGNAPNPYLSRFLPEAFD